MHLQALSEEDVVHFDLKCDNVLLEMLPHASEEEFWNPSTEQPAFKVVLADFGDSCDFSQSDQKFTTRYNYCAVHASFASVSGTHTA